MQEAIYEPVYIRLGEQRIIRVGYSEVACYMGVAGNHMWVQLVDNGTKPPTMAQLFELDTGDAFSAPITTGEAGLFRDGNGNFYGYGPIGR